MARVLRAEALGNETLNRLTHGIGGWAAEHLLIRGIE
jgi:hypothetical protein